MTTRDEIREWFEHPWIQGPTHMIVVCDTYDWEDYPVYVKPTESPREVLNSYINDSMSKVMEVYSYSLDIESQLAEHRAWHI